MKICDLTQFYSPVSGGVKRYVHEKIAFVQKHRPNDEHVLVIPGAKTEITSNERSRIYAIRSPLVSRTAQYRALLDLRALEEVIEREHPDIIESGDPYQVGWKALSAGRARHIPVVAFYHSHFAEAYFRRPAERFGRVISDAVMKAARSYTRHFYNRFDATLIPSAGLIGTLSGWGITNARKAELGVDTEIFNPDKRASPGDNFTLLYVGRLAPEKNTDLLFDAFSILAMRSDRFRLTVIGDGQEREHLRDLQRSTGQVTWLPYCSDAAELAGYYRAADLFVHPGVEETFGLVALESQACGTPVVGIRGSYMDEVILHDQSTWATENNADALANAIAAMSMRPDLRALGLAAAQEVAARYAWPQVFSRLFSIYEEVIAS